MSDPSKTIAPYLRRIDQVFRGRRDKRGAHTDCAEILREMADDPGFLTALLRKNLETPGALNRKNYPVVALDIALNAYYGMVANCWIPLPSRETHISTKSVHHHGEMILSTVTAFGPGYEHWMFTLPESIDASQDLYATQLLERAAHPRGHVAVVDSYIAHVPMFPPALSITYALWSGRKPTTWVDHAKRVPLVQKNSAFFRSLAVKAGMVKALDIKQVVYFDYYPVDGGFKGMKDRQEFGLGPNADHLKSLFHVIQTTGNQALAPLIRERLAAETKLQNRVLIEQLVDDLERGRPIEGQLSEGHTGVPYANFTAAEMERALAAVDNGSQVSTSHTDQAVGRHYS